MPTALTPLLIQELLIVTFAIILALRLRFASLRATKLGAFVRLCQELLWAGKHAELLELIEEHRISLFRLMAVNSISERLMNYLNPSRDLWRRSEWDLLLQIPGQTLKRSRRRTISLLSVIRMFPGLQVRLYLLARWWVVRRNIYGLSQELARSVFLTKPFAAALVSLRPYLGLKLIDSWGKKGAVSEFIELYVANLMETPNSVLFRELRDNQNMSGSYRYDISEANLLLQFFISDSKRANDLSVYRPVGNTALVLLDRAGADPLSDPYNQDLGNFKESRIYDDPIYAAIHFFRIMVLEGIHQDVGWHLWLYYLQYMVEKMARNYEVRGRFSSDLDEFPNRYAYLIYESVDSLIDFVKAGEEIDSANLVLKVCAERT